MPLPKGLPSKRTRYSTVCGVINTVLLIILFLFCALYACREIYLIFSEDAEVITVPQIVDTNAPAGSEFVEVNTETESEANDPTNETPEPEVEDTTDETAEITTEEDNGAATATEVDEVITEVDEVITEVETVEVEEVEEIPIEDLLRVA